jgi:hypothetical protein
MLTKSLKIEFERGGSKLQNQMEKRGFSSPKGAVSLLIGALTSTRALLASTKRPWPSKTSASEANYGIDKPAESTTTTSTAKSSIILAMAGLSSAGRPSIFAASTCTFQPIRPLNVVS